MDDNKKRSYYSEYEIVGNTARKLKIADKPYIDEDKKTKEKSSEYRQQRLKHELDPVAAIIFVISLLAAVYLCVGYLKVQSDIVQIKKKIIALENELDNIRDLNEGLYMKANSAIDLEYIYNVAVNDLGMVFANESEVVSYKKSNKGFVRQYEILEKNDNNFLVKVIEDLKP